MANGTVKWFNATKGYGFITPDDSDKDVFIHITALEQAGINKHQFSDGQKVSYEVATTNGKASAVDIVLI